MTRSEIQQWYDNTENHNFHDSELSSIQVIPSDDPDEGTSIEVILSFGESVGSFRLSFIRCSTIKSIIDFDILRNNQGRNVAGLDVRTDQNAMRKLILSSIPISNVRYQDDPRKFGGSPFNPGSFAGGNSPVYPKLDRLDQYRQYNLSFFGGNLVIIAESMLVKPIDA